MKKNPSYSSILKAISKARTLSQLKKQTKKVIYYAGPAYKASNLFRVYEKKGWIIRDKIRNKRRSRPGYEHLFTKRLKSRN